jgi:hypothetical protein
MTPPAAPPEVGVDPTVSVVDAFVVQDKTPFPSASVRTTGPEPASATGSTSVEAAVALFEDVSVVA